jgi:hypothetical protein
LYIPNSAKRKIKKVFYDKVLSTYEIPSHLDDEGGKVQGDPIFKGNFKGNVIHDLKLVQETYGLTYEAGLAVSTDSELVVPDDLISYQGVKYKIKEIKLFDSYKLVVGVLYGD